MWQSSVVIVAAMEDSEAPGLRFDPFGGDRCCHSGGTETWGLRSSRDRFDERRFRRNVSTRSADGQYEPPTIGALQSNLPYDWPMLVPESDSGMGKKRCCCAGAEIPRDWVAKIAPRPRKAVGCQSSARGV